jgi:DNA invertase Pin-like site-specific DNA recombinase
MHDDQGTEWTPAERRELDELRAREALLPPNAPRALLSIRLSVLTDETTSPVRQELDLYRMAVDRGSRVIGVARDLGVSATKVPPWKRPKLGDWIKNRAPEFDEILFWKLDRFVRRISDLHLMIEWCKEYDKILAAKNDPIDLSTEFGQFMVTIIAGMARIEAANTGVRIESLWQFARTSERWVIGKPVYGYVTVEADSGGKILDIDKNRKRVLKWIYAMMKRGRSLYRISKILNRARISPPSGQQWSSGNLKVILINPALMGYRTHRPKGHKQGKPPLISYGNDGQPIKVAEAIFTKEDFSEIQRILGDRANKKGKLQGKKTLFLGILKCAVCGRNMYDSPKQWTLADGTKRKTSRLRCSSYLNDPCGSASFGNPDAIYDAIYKMVVTVLGDFEVVHREYARGAENRTRKLELEASIAHYMKELEPGGQFKVGGFIEKQARQTLGALGEELGKIDPETTEDRWIYQHAGITYRKHWENSKIATVEDDLTRAGVTCMISEGKEGEPEMEVKIPKDVQDRLIKRDDFFVKKF